MIDTQLGQLELGGKLFLNSAIVIILNYTILDDITFAILLELRHGKVPTIGGSETDPPPWISADPQSTTLGASNEAGLHMIRAVNTGVINVAILDFLTFLSPLMIT
jgi:mitotic spindle assembly checkpoint protein MAD2B